jgi:capsular polysaccharide biosynthesis protein
VLWLRGSGAIFDGETGLAIEGSYVTRGPDQRDVPHTTHFRAGLSQSLRTHQRLERAVLMPSASCSIFREFITETLAFLWPFMPDPSDQWLHWPVLLNGCDPQEPTARILHAIVRDAHAFPLLEQDLPEALHIEELMIPEPSLRLQAYTSATYLCTAAAMGDWLLNTLDAEQRAPASIGKLFISRSGIEESSCRVEGEADLEALLITQGWTVFHPEQHPLAMQVATYRAAQVIAGFEGSALHGLALLAGSAQKLPALLILGDHPSLDLCLQFQAQRFDGFFLHCTRSSSEQSSHGEEATLRLNGSVEQIAALIAELLSACE